MARIERFEDLVAWQRGRELTKALYQVTGNGRFARDRDLRGQMRRAAVSVRCRSRVTAAASNPAPSTAAPPA